MKTLRFTIPYPERTTGESPEERLHRVEEARSAYFKEWADTITTLTPFRAGKRRRGTTYTTMRGVLGMPHLPGCTGLENPMGSLPEPHRTQFRRTYLDYVIYSYDTPIAWRGTYPHEDWRDGYTYHSWHVPDVNYSVTTKNHQWEIIAALKYAGVEFTTGEPVNTRTGKGRSPFGPREGGRGW